MANSGIEVEVYKDTAPFDKVGIIEARKRPTALREIGGVGAGSFQVAKSNQKIVDDPTLLDYRNFMRIRVNGQCVGGFILKNKDHQIVGKGEKAEEVWELSGEGLRSWGKDAVVRPAKGVTPFSRETRYFNFATEQGAWYNSSQWVNATRIAKWNGPGNWWRTAPSDWPDSPNAYWIWDRSGPYAMPQGHVYIRKEFSITEAGQYALFFAVDDAAEVYLDGELIHTTAEHAWQETTREDVDLDVGAHVLAFKAYNYKSDAPGALIAAFYKIGNASSPTAASQMFVTDNTWKVCAYPAVEPGWTPGQILLTLMAEAKARGVRFANNVTPTFTGTHDSGGTPWGDPLAISFDVGTNYEEVFEALEEAGCDIFVDPETLQLRAWKDRGADRSLTGTAGGQWVEQRRNLVPVPQPTAYAGSGWAASSGVVTETGWVSATINSSTTGYVFTDGSELPIFAGETITFSLRYKVTAMGTGSATHVQAVPHIRGGNTYIIPTLDDMLASNTLRPIVLNQVETMVFQWTADRDIAAGDLDIALTTNISNGGFASVTGGFAWQATRALIEKGATDGSFFDGSTPDTSDLQYDWTGPINNSISSLKALVGIEPIVLRVGHNLKTAEEKGQADIVNTLILNTADGWTVKQPSDTASVTKYGVLEGQISTDLSEAQATSLVGEVFNKKSLPEKTATFELIPVPGMVPFENFFEGDYVSAPGEVPGVMEKRRVMSISIGENAVGNPVYAIEFDAIFGDRADDLAKMLSKATHSSALGGGFTGTTGTPQTDTKGSNSQLPVAAPPEKPTGVVVSTVGRWGDNGSAVSDYGLTWNGVIANVDGLPVTDIDKYEVWARLSTESNYRLLATVFDTFAYLAGHNPGEDWYFQIRANSRTGGFGEFSDPVHLIANAPVIPLGAPSTPTLISEMGTVAVRWDGLIAGSPAPARFKNMEIHRSTAQNGTYVAVGSFVTGSGTDTTGLVGTTYWYRLVPVDFLGVKGTPSIAVSIAVAGVATSDLDQAINDAISGAVDAANQAVTAANGKNKITFSNAAPTTSNTGIAGDMWYRRDGAGKLIGVWENTGGTTWVARTLTGTTLSDIDAGTVTTGFLGADRIGANTITSKKMLIANLDNQLDNPNFETNSFLGWEQTGSTAGWTTPTSSVDYINRYLQRTTVAAAPVGQITNGFRVAVRPEHRLRIDALSNNTGITPGPWTEVRRNYFADPYGITLTSVGAALAGDLTNVGDMPGSVTTGVRFTRTATGAARFALNVGTSMFRNTNGRFRMRARASEATTVGLLLRVDPTSTTGQSTVIASYSIPAGVSEIDITGAAGTAAATADTGLVFTIAAGTVGATLDLTNITIETAASGALGGGFTGATVSDSDLGQYAWVGAENASQSIYQTRTAPSSIGVQFYNAAGAELTYVPKALVSSGNWQAISWETNVPAGAYFASLRVEDAGAANSTLRLANLQFRLMGAGQLLVDGTIQGRHVAADTLEGRSIKASTIEVDRLSPNVGSSLDLDGNTNINALKNVTEAQQTNQAAQQQQIEQLDSQTDQLALEAASAAADAAAAQILASGLQAGIDNTQQGLTDLGRTYRFTENGAFIGSPGSPYEFVIQNTGAEIRYNGTPVSSWDSGRMIVDQFVGNEVSLGNHKLMKDTASGGTVVQKIG